MASATALLFEHIKQLINSKKGFSLNYEIETKKGDINNS
jgi:hypothetical protein